MPNDCSHTQRIVAVLKSKKADMAIVLHRLHCAVSSSLSAPVSSACTHMQKSVDCIWNGTHIKHQAVCSALCCKLILLPFGYNVFTRMLKRGNEQLSVHQAAPLCSCEEQSNETNKLTAGKAVSPPSSVVLARYSNTVATLGESSTRES